MVLVSDRLSARNERRQTRDGSRVVAQHVVRGEELRYARHRSAAMKSEAFPFGGQAPATECKRFDQGLLPAPALWAVRSAD